MDDEKNTEEEIKRDAKEILDLLKHECGPGTHERRETYRQYLTVLLNYKFSKTTESLSIKILWLNRILVFLTIILVGDAIIRVCGFFLGK